MLPAKNLVDDSAADVRRPLLRALPRVREDLTDGASSPAPLLEATIINPVVEREWDKWIDSHPKTTVFHSSAWARVLVETYGHLPCYLRICAQGELIALVPVIEVQSLLTKRRGVCLPFTDYCAPLLFNVLSRAAVMDKVRQVARERKWSYFELRADSIISAGEATASESYYGHRLDLRPGGKQLFAGFEPSVQRAIRKAERSQLRATVDSTPEAMDSLRSRVRSLPTFSKILSTLALASLSVSGVETRWSPPPSFLNADQMPFTNSVRPMNDCRSFGPIIWRCGRRLNFWPSPVSRHCISAEPPKRMKVSGALNDRGARSKNLLTTSNLTPQVTPGSLRRNIISVFTPRYFARYP